MTPSVSKKWDKQVIALALTWDGARWPVRSLSTKARAFLKGKASSLPAPVPHDVSKLFMNERVQEIRVCWVPRLKGGRETLSEPFATLSGKRLVFRAVEKVSLGEMLGMVYRRR